MFPSQGKPSSLLVCSQPLSWILQLIVAAENNPEVMSTLVHKLGLSTALSFHDVFSIEDPDLLAFVPRPASALLLVFPVSRSYELFRMQEDEKKTEYEGKGSDEPVLWYKQTIRNACGLIGLLHAVSNGSSRGFIGMYFLQVQLENVLITSRTRIRSREAGQGCHASWTYSTCRPTLQLASSGTRTSRCRCGRTKCGSRCRGQYRLALRLLCKGREEQLVGNGWQTERSIEQRTSWSR